MRLVLETTVDDVLFTLMTATLIEIVTRKNINLHCKVTEVE
jgi:hypothetical protein